MHDLGRAAGTGHRDRHAVERSAVRHGRRRPVSLSHDAPIARDSRPTRRFGEQLHVAVVPVPGTDPNQPMLPGHTYSYDVEFTGASGASNLRAAGLLKNEKDGHASQA